jgi:tetratricopeptide (TPR) repeat protein
MLPSIYAAAADNDTSTKRERNYIKEGNKLYKDGNYAQAEVAFSKAMEANPQSEVAAYNYASALVKQSGAADPNNGKDPLSKARNIYSQLNESANNTHVAEWSAYNLGNMAFNQQQWQQAIDYYKNALRRNPDNDKARENLRLAQLKKQQQDQQNQNQDQNKQDQQNQDQQQDKQDQQQQNQDKNQDDKQDKQDQQKQQQEQDQQQQQQPQQQQISNANMQKILDTVDKAEAATRAKVDADKKKDDAKAAARILGNQW